MTPTQQEQIEVLRRIAERGLMMAQDRWNYDGRFVDLFQHMLDEIERIK